MQKFIKSLFLFSFFAIAFYTISLILFGRFMYGNFFYPLGESAYFYSRLNDAKKVKKPQILFLGSSHAYRGFDTRIFAAENISSFNIGSSNQTPIQTLFLLKRYLESIHPTSIVFEVYPGNFEADGVESTIGLFANDYIDFNSVKLALQLNHITVYNVFVYALFRQSAGLNKNFKEPIRYKTDTYVSGGGFVEKDLAFNTDLPPTEKRTLSFRPQQLKAFEKCLSLIKEKNIPYILVRAPVSSPFYNSFSNNKEMNKVLSSYGKFYDFNQLLILNDTTDYYNRDHLNKNGVAKFNKKLIEVMRENKLLK